MPDAVETSLCPRCGQALPVTQTTAQAGEQLALDHVSCPNCGVPLVRDIEGHSDRGWRLEDAH